MKGFTQNIRKHLSALPGWNTGRKLIIIESDDWGSIRMPSIDVHISLCESGLDMESDEGVLYNRYDSLETSEDLASLFEVLSSVKDISNRYAVLTPVSVTANPDFEKIRANEFREYFFEPFTSTLQRYKGCENSFALWVEGIDNRLFVPQFHGREHLNVKAWMKALSKGNNVVITGFDHSFWGMTTQGDPDIGLELQAAFDFIEPLDLKYHHEVLSSGLRLFKDIFGYNASYFVPPNGPLSSTLEPLLKESGIKFLSMPRIQAEPMGYYRTRKRIHWLGKRTPSNLTIITRNCFFEPVIPGIDWVDRCLSDIEIAFKWRKPAVISSHRVNYIGALYPENRRQGLKQLSDLLNRVVLKWPDIEFLTSEELGDLMSKK